MVKDVFKKKKKRLTREGQRHPRGNSVLGHKSSSYPIFAICFKQQFCFFFLTTFQGASELYCAYFLSFKVDWSQQHY